MDATSMILRPPRLLLRRLLVAFALLALPFGAAAFDFQWSGFERLERDLRLHPWQKQQFETAVQATHKAALAIGLGVLQAKGRLARELMKDSPDPSALFEAQEQVMTASRPYVRRARDEWTRFYATLDEEQLRLAKAFVEEKLRLIEKLGDQVAQYLTEQLKR